MATERGINGQEKARLSVEMFETVMLGQPDEFYIQMIYRGQLSRKEVSKFCDCTTSALRQNPALKRLLNSLEDDLRRKGILPQYTDVAKLDREKPKQYDPTASRKMLDSKRVSALEAENIELKAKVTELEKRLERFGELSETLSELGFMPR